MFLSPLSLVMGVVTIVFYVGTSATLQWAYYWRRKGDEKLWKSQPAKLDYQQKAEHWWVPILDIFYQSNLKPGRHPLHGLFATVNLLIATTFMVASTELTIRGYSRLIWSFEEISLPYFLLSTLLALAWENVLEYYYHIIMHTRFFYTWVHKYHHHYKNPEPFDDLMVAPVEVTFFYCILFSPPFVIPMHIVSLLIYASIMGITGITDHCGIKLKFFGLYNSEDHDLHHLKTTVNYGFPFIFMDLLHGTYRDPHRVIENKKET